MSLSLLLIAGDVRVQVVTVRGRTGCVLLMCPAASEDARAIADCMRGSLPGGGLRQTRVVFTDDPSAHLLSTLQNIMPSLEVVCLDPVHLCMTFEYGTYRKRTRASTVLRMIMQKFSAVDLKDPSPYRTPPFNGVHTVEFDHITETRREHILTGGMGKVRAERLIHELDPSQPWQCERDFVEALAALARCFPEDVDKVIPGPNRTGRNVLHTACAPARLQWYWNNLRARHTLSQDELVFLPTGTTSNEALHAEVRSWFRETQKMHQSTLQLKLRILHLSKLIAHNLAMYRPTLRQVTSNMVLARAVVPSPWPVPQWKEFASGANKANLPLNKKRARDAALVKFTSLKKPASALKKPASAPKSRRTPFNRERLTQFHIMGKKRP